jgi:superfamily I DNA/RNA helicase
MLRAMTTPKRNLGKAAIREFDEYCEKVEHFWVKNCSEMPRPSPLDIFLYLSGSYIFGVAESTQFPAPSASISASPLKIFAEFASQMLAVRDKASCSSLSKTLQSAIATFDLEPYFKKISKSKDEVEERLANVAELVSATTKYHDDACLPLRLPEQSGEFEETQSPLGSFLDDISLVIEQADTNVARLKDKKFVANLMTIHASKGMEFDTVFFVGVEDGVIPSHQVSSKSNRLKSISHLNLYRFCVHKSLVVGECSIPFEEERRLCYVAMTRAKSELILTWRQSASVLSLTGHTRLVQRTRSRFLDDVLDSNEILKEHKCKTSAERDQIFENDDNDWKYIPS